MTVAKLSNQRKAPEGARKPGIVRTPAKYSSDLRYLAGTPGGRCEPRTIWSAHNLIGALLQFWDMDHRVGQVS